MNTISKEQKRPLLIAHRGARYEAPENTGAAFDKALSYPIDGIELDVQMTKEGKPVLYHDKTLFKINRSNKSISDYTYEQLSSYTWSKWFSPEYAGEPLLTLEKTLQQYAHRTRLLIEIKSGKADQVSGKSLELTDKVLKEIENPVIQAHKENLFILSFDPEVLKFAFKKAPNLKYVLNLDDSDQSPTSSLSIITLPHSETDHLYALCVEEKYLSEKLVTYTHNLQKLVMTYTCNMTRQVEHALSMNADAIMSDKPGWLTDFFKRN